MKTSTIIVIWVAVIIGIILSIGSLMWALPNYSRFQARQDAQNQVAINTIIIQQQEQNIQVEQQKAQIRVVDAEGIAKAQSIISASLTDAYLQYLAIQAQQAFAASPNHTEVYIPVGTNGLPLIKTVGNNN